MPLPRRLFARPMRSAGCPRAGMGLVGCGRSRDSTCASARGHPRPHRPAPGRPAGRDRAGCRDRRGAGARPGSDGRALHRHRRACLSRQRSPLRDGTDPRHQCPCDRGARADRRAVRRWPEAQRDAAAAGPGAGPGPFHPDRVRPCARVFRMPRPRRSWASPCSRFAPR